METSLMDFALLFTIDECPGDSGGGGGTFMAPKQGVFASEKKERAFSWSVKHIEDELVFNCDNNDESFCPLSEIFRAGLLVDGETVFEVFDFGSLGVSTTIIRFEFDRLYSAFNLR